MTTSEIAKPGEASGAAVKRAAYGLWESRISPKLLSQAKRFSDLHWDSDGKTLVWLEGRSDRSVLMALDVTSREAPRELTGELSVKAKLGYGGGDFTVGNGLAVFAEGKSGRLYSQSLAGGAARPITPPFGAAAAPRLTPDGRYVTYIHHDAERIDRLALVDVKGENWPQILHQGHDFYAYNRVGPEGHFVAFVAWDHPNMPWDGSYLYLAPLLTTGGGLPRLGEARRVAGGKDTAIIQPEFSADGKTLYYISDESGIGNLHALDLGTMTARAVTSEKEADLGRPAWLQDLRTFALDHASSGKSAFVARNLQGFVATSKIDLATGKITPCKGLAATTDIAQLASPPSATKGPAFLAVIGSSSSFGARVEVYDGAEDRAWVVARAGSDNFRADELSSPEALNWPTGDGGKEKSYGLYYPPNNPLFSGSGRPPLVVIVHGGPTSQVRASWQPQAQFFATRGYGVLYVNHRGSTGFGRAYMLKHRGAWGLVDVEDAISGAQFLAKAGKIDGTKTIIMGGSAGGYTVLQTMVDYPEAFSAGICLYGIANQFSLLAGTHKFEERYSDSLLGPLPEAAELYRRRSPLFHAQKIKRPMAVFQGDQDKVVPKDQSDVIVKALQRNGTPHVYHVYQGEGHGWQKAETIEHFYKAVDDFLKEHVVYA